MRCGFALYETAAQAHGNFLKLPRESQGRGSREPHPFLFPSGTDAPSFWTKQNPAASGGEVEEGEVGREGGVG
jgi:hypothetical protein